MCECILQFTLYTRFVSFHLDFICGAVDCLRTCLLATTGCCCLLTAILPLSIIMFPENRHKNLFYITISAPDSYQPYTDVYKRPEMRKKTNICLSWSSWSSVFAFSKQIRCFGYASRRSLGFFFLAGRFVDSFL